MDSGGRLWTPVDLKAFRSGLCGRLWTPVDAAWPSTDQKVGVRVPPGVLRKPWSREVPFGVVPLHKDLCSDIREPSRLSRNHRGGGNVLGEHHRTLTSVQLVPPALTSA